VKILEIRGRLRKVLEGDEPEDIYLDMEGTSVIINISYRVRLDVKYRTQTRVISCLYSALKKYI